MKMLKSKNIRRICVLLAMLAPVVYLFGSLFSALTGAHGTEVFAEPVYVQQYVETDNLGDNYGYVEIGSDVDMLDLFYLGDNSSSNRFDFSFNGGDYVRFGAAGISTTFNSLDIFRSDDSFFRLGYFYRNSLSDPWSFSLQSTLPWRFYGDSLRRLAGIENAKYYTLIDVPSSEVPENAGAYSDYVFKNFFAKDNFLEQIGKNVLSDNPHGFVPFAAFWKYLDNNMLHMGDMQLGLMGYGYVYYCCHVLLFDIAFILVTFFLDFIQKVNDKVVGGVD